MSTRPQVLALALKGTLAFGALLFLVAAACQTPSPTSEPATPTLAAIPTPPPTPTPGPLGRFRVEMAASGLKVPWALAFAPDGRLFFTERPGRLRVIAAGRLLPEPVATLPVAAEGEAGLLGLALDPGFSQNRYLYVYYTYREGNELKNRIVRLKEAGNRAGEPLTVLDGIPGATIHDGGRLRFGPDGKLYATTGDAARSSLAQDPASLAGKILRLNADGTIPQDNPSPGSPVWSLGHRNPQGLAWHPLTGQLYATEHGPTGNDEVNIIAPGANYGWPEAQGRAGRPAYRDPIAVYSPAIAPSGAAFYGGQLYFATLRGEHLHRLTLGGEGYREVLAAERLLEGDYGRLRDVMVGPDGALYVTTSNRDGRGRPAATDDRILRLLPED